MSSSSPLQNLGSIPDQLETLYQSIRSGSIRFTSEQLLNFVDQTRRNLTLALLPFSNAHHLDKELDNDIYLDEEPMPSEHDHLIENIINTPVISAGQGPVITKVLKTVGRATSYRKRKSDFSTRRHIDPDAERRSSEANFKAARRKAADKASHRKLCTWAGLTFDDVHLSIDPKIALERFNRNLRDYIHRHTPHTFHYCEVLSIEGGRQHIHALFPEWIDWELIDRFWIYGSVHIEAIIQDQIDEKVGYMADNIKEDRYTNRRFVESHGDKPIAEYFESDSYRDARDVLEEVLAPNKITPTLNKPFTPDGLISYKFAPTEPT